MAAIGSPKAVRAVARPIRAGRRRPQRRISFSKTPGGLKSSVRAVWSAAAGASIGIRPRQTSRNGPRVASQRARSELPEEGLEPTRTYAQALLRRPRLPFRHSGGETLRVYPTFPDGTY